MCAPAGSHFHSHVFSVILYNPHCQYILLPVNTVKQSSLLRCLTCPPPVLSEVHPSQPARVPLSHKHESKHRVLPPDFVSFNKGNERNKKQCRVAEITTSPTILKYDGFRSKISRQGSKNQARTWALPALHLALICCREKIIYTCISFWRKDKKKKKQNSHRKMKKSHRDKSRGIVCVVDEFSGDNGGSTHTG